MFFVIRYLKCLKIGMTKSPRKRVRIKGHYMQVRQRSTRKGKKGTIYGKWASNKGKKRIYKCNIRATTVKAKNCGYKKAGKYCLFRDKEREKCARLVISYK